MERAVTYSVVAKKNPRDPEGEVKYYAQAQARGETGIRSIAERIQKSCTVTRSDIMAVLAALSEEEYNSSQISKARINFRPSVDLQAAINGLSYQRVPVKPAGTKSEETV